MSTNAVNKVRMLIITVSVTVSSIKIQLLMILKKGLLTESEKFKKKKKDSQKGYFFFGRACFGWVGRSSANQHFLRSALPCK